MKVDNQILIDNWEDTSLQLLLLKSSIADRSRWLPRRHISSSREAEKVLVSERRKGGGLGKGKVWSSDISTIKIIAVVVDQLVEQSLPATEVRDSNPSIGKRLCRTFVCCQLCWKKDICLVRPMAVVVGPWSAHVLFTLMIWVRIRCSKRCYFLPRYFQ